MELKMLESESNQGVSSASSGTLAERRLRRARQHVEQLWLPINPEVYQQICKGLVEGVYDLDLDFLVEDLKTDFGLFTRCLQQVTQVLVNRAPHTRRFVSPLEILKLAGIEQIKRTLLDAKLFNTSHSLAEINKDQADRINEMAISAAAIEVLAECRQIDSGTGFSLGLLRQLGLALVAWNYPTIYGRVFAQNKGPIDLDQALSVELGFSPALLAASLVEEWGFSTDIVALVRRNLAQNSVENSGRILQELCEIGEALARANQPNRYPTARSDWRRAVQGLTDVLGDDGLRIIERQLKITLVSYHRDLPEVFRPLRTLHVEALVERRWNEVGLANNQFLSFCPKAIQERITELYELRKKGQSKAAMIRFYIDHILPRAGYCGGSVYIIDPASQQLIPRIKLGPSQSFRYEPIVLNGSTESVSPILTAFTCNIPIVETGPRTGLQVLTYICSVLEISRRKVGVLHLEKLESVSQAASGNQLGIFKALREVLCDILCSQ